MALGFSSGLLTGMQTLGQGGTPVPQDPNQQNLLQKAGVTNPLLQQFGQGFGGVFGVETRSPMEQFAANTKGLDTSTAEGRAAYLRELAKVKPEEAVKQAMAFKDAEEKSRMRELQAKELELKIEAEKEKGNYKQFTYVVEEEYIDPNTFQTKTRKVERRQDARKINGEWYAVEPNTETGKIEVKRKLSEDEVKQVEAETGTVIYVDGKQIPVFDRGDYYEDYKKVRYSKKTFDILKKDKEKVIEEEEVVKEEKKKPVQQPVATNPMSIMQGMEARNAANRPKISVPTSAPSQRTSVMPMGMFTGR